MNSSTLRGVFPEPKPVYKRNFIKENMKYIKQMQGLVQESELAALTSLQDKSKLKAMRTVSRPSSMNKSQHDLTQSIAKVQKVDRKKNVEQQVPKLNLDKRKGETLNIKPHLPAPLHSVEKFVHRGVQTDNPEDIQKLFKNGIIRYPSPSVVNALAAKRNIKSKNVSQDRGDNNEIIGNPNHTDLSENMQSLDLNEKHDYIKENILALKHRTVRHHDDQEPKSEYHQKGVVPKYLRERKEEQLKDAETDPECPHGHVLLPDEERKETLRVLRQSYADRIQELNSMPVRSDTLRMRRRKMELEEELKKIDEGIKVFQRPKVFVKINA